MIRKNLLAAAIALAVVSGCAGPQVASPSPTAPVPSVAASPASAAPSSPTSLLPDGSWQVELSVADLAKAGAPREGLENATYRWTFEGTHAHIAVLYESGVTLDCDAVAQKDGDAVVLRYTGCGDEVDRLQWRVEADELRFTLLETNQDFASNRAYLEAKAWRSVPSDAGTIAAPREVDRVQGLFDIGVGRQLYLLCSGTGTPTILLEAGDGGAGPNAWARERPALYTRTRTCTYERAGIGRSSAASGCRQLDDLVDDLDALLAAAAIGGPYLLVGASGGGFIMAGFAARHPDQVAGMVFVETPKALSAELHPDVLPQIKCDAAGNVERRDYLAVEHDAWDNRHELGDFPLTIISNDYGDSAEPNTDEATNVEDQRGWFDLTSADGRQVVVTTGHGVAPDVVIDEVLAVLRAAQGKQEQ